MLKRTLLGMAAALALAPAAALATPPADLDAYVARILKDTGAPGMSVSIVEGGKTVYVKGFGVRKLGSPERIDAHTVSPTGSTGKAFTVAALATLVDAGKIKWDDHVIDHLPWFQMYDPWVTREMTIRDLLVHRSGLGLGQGDLLFVPRSTWSRRDSVYALRYLKPHTSFRSAYAYDNVLYMVAGQLIEEVTGQTWEDYVASHVLKPAGMTDTVIIERRFDRPDRTWPHARLNGAFRGLGDMEVLNEHDMLGANSAPAGGLAISPTDFATWAKIQLAHGALPDGKGRLFSEEQSKQMWTPQIHQPIRQQPPELAAAQQQFSSYALGWDISDWRGHKIVSHGGGDIGHIAMIVLIPEKNVGFTIEMNSEEGVALKGLMNRLLDHYLGYGETDWEALYKQVHDKQVAAALKALPPETAPEGASVGPALPLDRYAGTYKDPWYGPIEIRNEGGKLLIDFKHSPGMVGELRHYQYETFKTIWRDKVIEPAFVTFQLTADGKIERASMKAVSPLADFSWDYHDLDLRPVAAAQ
jgi:CubicO group peptidase (beta-lactamase class C family)